MIIHCFSRPSEFRTLIQVYLLVYLEAAWIKKILNIDWRTV